METGFLMMWLICNELLHDKTNKMICAPQRRLRSAWASAQSDQSSLCAQLVAKGQSFLQVVIEDCSDWADAQADLSLRWAHIILFVSSCACSNDILSVIIKRIWSHQNQLTQSAEGERHWMKLLYSYCISPCHRNSSWHSSPTDSPSVDNQWMVSQTLKCMENYLITPLSLYKETMKCAEYDYDIKNINSGS